MTRLWWVLVLVVCVRVDATPLDQYLNVLHQLNKIHLDTVPDNSTICWKDSYGRGVGHPIDTCATGLEEDAGLCYPPCQSGYTGVSCVCWENCQPGFTDEGALCGKSGSIVPADTSKCPWYNKCSQFGADCSTCSDPTAHNDGCTCRIDPQVYAKKSYGRGAGVPLGCGSDQYFAGLCYPYCKAGYYGFGPVCWETCPSDVSADEGALCCASGATCNEKIVDMSKSVLQALADAIAAGEDPSQTLAALKAAIEAALGFVLPLCSDFSAAPRVL